jgi:hypothetical protein
VARRAPGVVSARLSRRRSPGPRSRGPRCPGRSRRS